jgi:hypothetical protein
MENGPDRKITRQVQQSMEVITSDGKLIGYVTAVKKKEFHVHRLTAPDISLDYSRVDVVRENTVSLTLSEHELALMSAKPTEAPLSSIPHPHRGEEESSTAAP